MPMTFSADDRARLGAVAAGINVPAECLLAVITVESGGQAFALVDGRQEPLIRWEGHYFDRLCKPAVRAAARKAGLASPTAGAIANPSSQAKRWHILRKGMTLDPDAAIQSCSWGVGQVMGAHWQVLGYGSPQALMRRARAGLDGQAELMARYIAYAKLDAALRRRDWSAFARGYNGPAYAEQGYHTKLAAAYEAETGSIAAPPTAGLLRLGSKGAAVRELQALLVRAGQAVTVDGDFGPATERAVEAWQAAAGLTADGIVGPQTLAALQRYKTDPREEPGLQPVATLAAVQTGIGGGLGGAVVLETARQTIDNALQQTAGLAGLEWLNRALVVASVALALAGLAYAGWGWIKRRHTFEGTA